MYPVCERGNKRQDLDTDFLEFNSVMMAEPTTAPSAIFAMAFEASGVLIPKPTTTGRSVFALIRATSGATSVVCASAAPVMPVIET